jgi:hypothetical protein
MSSVRTPARLWVSITVAAVATVLKLVAGAFLIIPAVLWIGVAFDWYSTLDYERPARPKRVPQLPRASWIPARDSHA